MTVKKQKSLVLILARELATNLATPIYIADSVGDLVYFNEPAEQIAGGRFVERGETSINDWVRMLAPETVDGKPLDREEMPGTMRVTGLDGHRRTVETTALPLFGPDGEFHGIMAIFWELG